MALLLIALGALLVAMIGCAVLRPRNHCGPPGIPEEQALMMAAIAMSVG